LRNVLKKIKKKKKKTELEGEERICRKERNNTILSYPTRQRTKINGITRQKKPSMQLSFSTRFNAYNMTKHWQTSYQNSK